MRLEAAMKNCIFAILLALFFTPAFGAEPPQQDETVEPPPPWAYGFTTESGLPLAPAPAAPAAAAPAAAANPYPDDGTLKHLPESTLAFTISQVRDNFNPADWYPNDHPAMPEVVAHGRRPSVRACAYCHYPNGRGNSENASLAGLPYEYFVQTMDDFKNGFRKSADWRKANTNAMAGFAKDMTDDEINAAAEYYSSIKWTPFFQVVETTTVPKTRIVTGMFLKLDGDAQEPLGQRIIEVPVNTGRTEVLRDGRSGFITYVPIGSVKKGEALVKTGGGKTVQCAACHGADEMGQGIVPPLAGRSASSMVRQMYDMKTGYRTGVWSSLMMKPIVRKLTNEDMLDIAAYLTSLSVSPASSASAAQ
jgi:cytochrome c553